MSVSSAAALPIADCLRFQPFTVRRPSRTAKWSVRFKASSLCLFARTEKNYGYFALISNDIKDPLEALGIYRSKDLVEKAFGNLKERLDLHRTSVSSEKSLEG